MPVKTFSDQLHPCPIDYVPLLANKIRERTEERNAREAGYTKKCCLPFFQGRSIFGHAKRNCASEAYEPPLRFGMIVSSKAATSSNSTRYSSNSSVAPDGLKGYCWRTISREKPSTVGTQQRRHSA